MERTKSAGIYINDGKRETVKERMLGNSVSYLIALDFVEVRFRNHMEIRIGMMEKGQCHLFKLQMFQTT